MHQLTPPRTRVNASCTARQTCQYVALFALSLGDATLLNLLGPPVTAIFARLLLKEPLGWVVVGGVRMCMRVRGGLGRKPDAPTAQANLREAVAAG
jgi:hypothetical protein